MPIAPRRSSVASPPAHRALLAGAALGASMAIASASSAQPVQPAQPAGAQPPAAAQPAAAQPDPAQPPPADPTAPNPPPTDPVAGGAAPIAPPPVVTEQVQPLAVPAPKPTAGRLGPDENAGWSERVSVEVGPLALKPIVLVTVFATPWAGDDSLTESGDIADQGGFRLRRGRLGLTGDLARKVRFEVTSEIGPLDSGETRIRDAWLAWVQYPFAEIYAGAHEVPYSRSAMTGSGDNALLERPFAVRAMAPQQQVGAHLEGRVLDGKLGYAAGAYNGFSRTDRFYQGYQQNYAPLGNRFGGLSYVGRLFSEPLGPLGPTIEDVGWSPFRFGAGAGYFFSDGGARDVHAVGGDVLVHANGFHLLGEVMWQRTEPESAPTEPTALVAEVTSFGLVGEAGFMVIARRLGISARIELVDPNQDSDDEGDNVIFTGGASWRPLGNENIKVGAEYTHREELFGLALDNDSLTLGLQLAL